MTSIAVTAIICASASEAAFLVASFMPNSLDLGMSHQCPGRLDGSVGFYSERPATSIRSFESPLSEYRQSRESTSIEAAIWLARSRFVHERGSFLARVSRLGTGPNLRQRPFDS